ncbi:hypothetical protein [Virgibacillus salexigens]|uniref:Uncharacterized protein n=1 Tax=Virgibacillus massiliensis TaxID=1462526 RepID=A0A024QHY6_9BACI|nr:hypothetical protein [Virgibacillus massiliensis]CDQ41857.1 hypothetical protein BN990_04236 [Virgibacillus massiliensis]
MGFLILIIAGIFTGFGFIIGIEYWKRKSILGYQNGYEDGIEDAFRFKQ